MCHTSLWTMLIPGGGRSHGGWGSKIHLLTCGNGVPLIAVLGIRGVRCSTVMDGAVNADVFESFVERVLAPELRPGDVIMLDNLSSHKSARKRELIESTGAELVFLPPYSPDLNPIEMVFSKVKQLLRNLACRTRDQLWRSMQRVLDAVTPSDAANCFMHCGYTLHNG